MPLQVPGQSRISERWWPVEEEFQASNILWFCGDWGRCFLRIFGFEGSGIVVVHAGWEG